MSKNLGGTAMVLVHIPGVSVVKSAREVLAIREMSTPGFWEC